LKNFERQGLTWPKNCFLLKFGQAQLWAAVKNLHSRAAEIVDFLELAY